MKLRIYRTYSWVLDASIYEVRFGGENPYKLETTDELQFLTDDGMWQPVPIEHGEIPKHPHSIKREEMMERLRDSISKLDIPKYSYQQKE